MAIPDPDQFRVMYAEHYDRVLRYAWRRTGADAAADVTAEVFMVAWRRMGEVPAQQPLPWLYGVARKVVANHLREQNRSEELPGPMADAVLVSRDVAEQVTARHRVHRAWQGLSEADRELLALIGWEGLSVRDAAKVLGCTAAACAVRLHRARRRLQQALSQQDAEHTSDLADAVVKGDARCA
ncbi:MULTISPECIES: RNA polymerase sigma factor [unclassified Streptomyces]|uniref:RNA polymerase sigma factor n=1 Tax=unclassified Streptomyces TaxID=2593676 RepID=UPI002252E1DD|nr:MULTISPECIES: sigma-70 family RNA polymerase sigma factor [unclassified Streptomyces]MCX5287071.1 sigma-70 family RNA polymerase sigma factor [Streptomyces sp. NBC_00183]